MLDEETEASVPGLEHEQKDFQEKALKCYSFALHKAEKSLISANAVRLSIALNFSVFHCDCLKDKDTATKMGTKAIEVALKKIDQLSDEKEMNDSKTLIDLIRENLATWEESEGNNNEEDDDDEPVKKKAKDDEEE